MEEDECVSLRMGNLMSKYLTMKEELKRGLPDQV